MRVLAPHLRRPAERPSSLTFLTVEEVAERLRLSKMTVYRMCQSDTIASVRIGRAYRIPIVAVEALEAMAEGSAE
ncbi:helix-turn-helix domain-containing protein [Nocardiopsis sp. YSL2]|uniref:helix-turn-helix domain-containing protein n=1 Tax=Nocardiopsis sp. YSL2 TaxID=2939492 RepID=UPI00350E3615